MTETSIYFHLKFTLYEEQPYRHVHLYLDIPDKNACGAKLNLLQNSLKSSECLVP